ncbi:DUF3131 domain-containing protein [Yoonia vestfoldensis]|uniref:DUF3131 domain-containing protein n=1 Tax=Yoonia vestfoldensis TaxID=245188 RepID=UPI0013A52F3E|nr:DUF3131 domain-containing protein [Yoonia vestfoldensis]
MADIDPMVMSIKAAVCVALDQATVLRCEIAIAEVLANIVRHAKPQTAEALFDLVVTKGHDAVVIEIFDPDGADPFDPRDHASDPVTIDPLAEGGRGLGLILACADTVAYGPVHGRNRLVLTFFKARKEPTEPQQADCTAIRRRFVKKDTISSWLLAIALAGSGLSWATPAVTQDNTTTTRAISINGVAVDGLANDRMTTAPGEALTILASEPDAEACVPGARSPTGAHFGRSGALTAREFEMAKTAWSYFETFYQPETGLVNAVGNFPSTTLWDTASYISALVAAFELCVIDKRELDDRATRILRTLRNLPLYRGEAPNKVYHAATAEMVNYANQPGEIGMSANDIGRLLVWLRILKERHPHLANSVDNVPMRWNFCNLINDDGRMFGSFTQADGATRYVQEGRLGYEEYAAKGFALWGFDVDRAMSPEPLEYAYIYDIRVPYDGRDPRVFKSQNYVLTEGYILDGLELGWDLPTDHANDNMVASNGWRAEFANRIYLVQERRFERTGIITARSEHQVEGSPYFVYDSIFADGYPWNTLDPTGEYQPDRAAVSAKAAIGLWALWDTPYTDLLFETVADLSVPDRGFYEGLYENGNGFIPLQTANNNGVILAALLYKVQGPILQHVNQNTQVWDTAFAGTDIRANKCHPNPAIEEITCCACASRTAVRPVIPVEEFLYCRPVIAGGDVAATACSTQEHRLAPLQAREVVAQSCPAPEASQ